MAGLVSPAILEQIRSANDIVDVIGAAIPLKRNGANFVALCPFHREKSPSFNVSPQRQSFHCFGCNKGGDVFTWVREYENLGFMDAVKRLAERANIVLEFEQTPGYQQARAVKDSLLAIHEEITRRWQNCLGNEAGAQTARDYLRSREISPEAVELFRLGFAPDLWDDTVNWARSKGHDLALVEQAGLILKRDSGEGYYDRFRGRLIFPICDEQGRVIGFSGRVLDPEAKTAKYVNSPETPLFTKGRVFFGLDKSKRAVLDEQRAIVCEGQLDLIRCFTSGVRNVVAPQGTALTAEHARILKRYAEEVVLCFDADEAGRNAAERSFESLVEAGLAVRVAQVPPPHDPDSFIRAHGGEAFRKVVDAAVGYFDFLLERLCAENDPQSDRGRLAVVRGMLNALRKSQSRALTEDYLQKTANRLGLPNEALRQDFKKFIVEAASTAPLGAEAEVAPVSNIIPTDSEIWLLWLLLRQADRVDWFLRYLDPQWIAHEGIREVAMARLANSESSIAGFIAEISDQKARTLASEVVARDAKIEDPDRLAYDSVRALRNRFIDNELNRIKAKAASNELNDHQQIELSQLAASLRHAKRQPLSPLAES